MLVSVARPAQLAAALPCCTLVGRLQIGGWEVTAVFVEAAEVVPVDPFGGGQLEFLDGPSYLDSGTPGAGAERGLAESPPHHWRLQHISPWLAGPCRRFESCRGHRYLCSSEAIFEARRNRCTTYARHSFPRSQDSRFAGKFSAAFRLAAHGRRMGKKIGCEVGKSPTEGGDGE